MDILETITQIVTGTQDTQIITEACFIIITVGIHHITMVDMDITTHITIIIHITTLHIFIMDIIIIITDTSMDGATHTRSTQTIMYLDIEKIYPQELEI